VRVLSVYLSLCSDRLGPNPPAPSFADDIACLASIWDDESPLWDLSQAVFKLKDRPIALKHWVDVYSRWKGQQWDSLKTPYSQWKVSPSCHTFSLSGGDTFQIQMIAECYMEGSAEDFW